MDAFVPQQRLASGIRRIAGLLDRYAARQSIELSAAAVRPDAAAQLPDATDDGIEPLDFVAHAFGLTAFERDLLLLCAGVELDADCAAAVSRIAGATPGTPVAPTFGLALAALPDAHWSALSPVGPLRYWRLVELGSSPLLTASPLRIDERILHLLTGLHYLDSRLSAAMEVVPPAPSLAPTHARLADRLASLWQSAEASGLPPPVLQICGRDPAINRDIAGQACEQLGKALLRLPASQLPALADLEPFQRLWEREAILVSGALLVDIDQDDDGPASSRTLATFIERAAGPLMLSTARRQPVVTRTMLTFDVARVSPAEQQALWAAALGDHADAVSAHLPQIVYQFDLKASAIEAAAVDALDRIAANAGGQTSSAAIAQAIWDSCREQARARLEDVVQRIQPLARWSDLILPDPQLAILRHIVDQVSCRATVYGQWGFSGKSERGLGLAAVFAGPSGTGKTLAAEVLAAELGLDLHRVDVSAVVSKFIGETEKNLRRVFDAAEDSGAILLFDEADALFGKRSEVKDSHDRHANIEVSYLLQRIEAYRGLAILTTNLKDSIDQAFLRRLRFIVQFPYPGAAERQRIWQQMFPVETPLDGLDFNRLAQLNLAGGSIRNIALNAAFLAAAAGQGVGMAHIREATRSEYAKLEKTITEAEMRGWG